MVDALRQDWEGADQWITQAKEQGAMTDESAQRFACALNFWRLAESKDWQTILNLSEQECNPEENKNLQVAVYLHNAACHLHDWELATSIESAKDEFGRI